MFRLWSFITAFVIVGLDQITKAWIRANLQLGETVFQWGFFRIDFVNNTGAAFGIFPKSYVLFTIVSSLGTLAFCALAYFSDRIQLLNGRWPKVALGLMLAGTMGNLLDRLFVGYVTDFIDFTYWPVFNVADASISIGVALFVLIFLTQNKNEGNNERK